MTRWWRHREQRSVRSGRLGTLPSPASGLSDGRPAATSRVPPWLAGTEPGGLGGGTRCRPVGDVSDHVGRQALWPPASSAGTPKCRRSDVMSRPSWIWSSPAAAIEYTTWLNLSADDLARRTCCSVRRRPLCGSRWPKKDRGFSQSVDSGGSDRLRRSYLRSWASVRARAAPGSARCGRGRGTRWFERPDQVPPAGDHRPRYAASARRRRRA